MSEGKPDLEATQAKVSFSTLRNIHRRNREEVQDAFFNRKKFLTDNSGIMSDVSKMLTRKEVEGDTDRLTGLLNKNGFQKRLKEVTSLAGRNGGNIWAVVMDADGLKAINDSEGHKEGDNYIAKIGHLFTQNLRAGDFVGRTGGDEFIAILQSTGGVEAWWERMNQDFTKNGVRISGGAIKLDAKNPTLSLEQADEAMYAAKLNKVNGKNNFMVAEIENGNLSFWNIDHL